MNTNPGKINMGLWGAIIGAIAVIIAAFVPVIYNTCNSPIKPEGKITIPKEIEIPPEVQDNQEPDDPFVYITRKGRRYHREDCFHLIGRITEMVRLSEAKDRGYTPCLVCRPGE